MKKRTPTVVIYDLWRGIGINDYFMEYAQGGIGILPNIPYLKYPIGYYVCRGMTAWAAFIRRNLEDSQVGVGAKKLNYIHPEGKAFIVKEISNFIAIFKKIDIDKECN